jgi:hypothetical protein
LNTASASTITLTGGGYDIGNLSGTSIGTIVVDDLSSYQNIWTVSNEEFINCFPTWDRIQDMCKEYPGLKIAYEKFVTTYKLVKDDYDTPKDQRPKP